MLIERDPLSGVLRVDHDGLQALVSASRGAEVPEAATVLETDGVGDAMATVTDPDVTVELVVGGTSTRLSHRIWVDPDRAVVLPELRPGLAQLMVVPPGHLAAALARLVRLRPRRTGERVVRPFPADRLDDLVAPDAVVRSDALAQAGAGFAWQLLVGWAGEARRVTAVDGPDGPFLADPDHGVLRPTTNTILYRLFATVLPPPGPPAAN